jgi:4-hydroxybenzoate polyprenyltransferase
MRPVMGLFAALLCLAAFRVQHPLSHYSWMELALPMLTSFLACSSAMVWNDLYDRDHDRKKGKRFAYDHPQMLFFLLIGILAAIGILAGMMKQISLVWTYLTIAMTAISLSYVRSYKYPVLATMIVAICSSVPSWYAITHNLLQLSGGLTIILIVIIVIGAREIIKDIEDATTDKGYKLTIPVVWGRETAWKATASLLLTGTAILCFVQYGRPMSVGSGLFFLCWIVVCWSRSPTKSKLTIDVSLLFYLLFLLFFSQA